MREFRYFIYMTQEELEHECPTYTGSVWAMNKTEALNKIRDDYDDAYYFYCI